MPVTVSVHVSKGYASEEVVRGIHQELHYPEGPRELGEKLPGGVRIYIEEELGDIANVRWSDPPIVVHQLSNSMPPNRQIADENTRGLDIFALAPPDRRTRYTGSSPIDLGVPRGTEMNAVFSVPLQWLTEGRSQVPTGVVYEHDLLNEEGTADTVGGIFARLQGLVCSFSEYPIATVYDIGLPHQLSAPWMVFPGEDIDPAILVKYVRDGHKREIEKRALWDYELDITGERGTFYVLSKIPRGFRGALANFFGGAELGDDLLVELGSIGIAIGNEVFRSGRHALGVVGLVGAVRLLAAELQDGPPPLQCNGLTMSFVIPVDSFPSFFGASDQSDGRRTDLLAVRITVLGSDEDKRLIISGCGVESKLVSGTCATALVRSALTQATSTSNEFADLVKTSLGRGGMPERLALIEILAFGLSIANTNEDQAGADLIRWEQEAIKAVLDGRYIYERPEHDAIVVSTEGRLEGAAECKFIDGSMWIRLTKTHWPGLGDSPSIREIREKLRKNFEFPKSDDGPFTQVKTPTRKASMEKVLSNRLTAGEEQVVERELPTSKEITIDRTEQYRNEPSSPLTGILIGVSPSRKPIYYDPQHVSDPLNNANLMVTGSSGTGKTQFLKYLICKVREQGKKVLVLDFKNDFASDSVFCEKAELKTCFVPFDGLPFNPLIPYPIRHPRSGEEFIQSSQYITGIASVLGGTYGLGVQQKAAVKRAIEAAFASNLISTKAPMPFSRDLSFPDFSGIGEILEETNPLAFNRLDPLFTLGLFRPEYQASSFYGLTEQSTVLDLSQIPSDEVKNTLAQLIVLCAHSYFNAQPHPDNVGQFLVFDEGHRVLASQYVHRLVRECRAYGVACVLSSQYPSDFSRDISASMATKVVHGNGADEARVKKIAELLGLQQERMAIARLQRFEAVLDNQHYSNEFLRTMNYPLYLVWSALQERGAATLDELSRTKGLVVSKLPISNLALQLESLGLAERKNGQVRLLSRE